MEDGEKIQDLLGDRTLKQEDPRTGKPSGMKNVDNYYQKSQQSSTLGCRAVTARRFDNG
jgi:hypothetical protein